MGLWTNKDHRTVWDDAEDLAHSPSQSPWTKWFTGCLLPSLILLYAVNSSEKDSIKLSGRSGSLMITGDDVGLLCAAYAAMAVFIHAHCFWCLCDRLEPYAEKLKAISLLVFLICVGPVFWHQLLF